MNILHEVLWNEEITMCPRKFIFFYILHSKHNYAVKNIQVNTKFYKQLS